MKIILISGKSGSGKTELANILKEMCSEKNIKAGITNFSKYLKLYAKEIIGWNEEKEPKPRKFLQDIGVEVRNMKENFLTSRMLEDIEVYKNYLDVLLISDVRLPNEIELFRKFNPLVIKIISNKPNKLTKSESEHYSENALNNYNNYDIVINNEGENLKQEALKIVKEYL